MQLAPEIEACGYRLITLDSTQSTNDDAASAARSGDPGRLWITAKEQRAGRGRHGRPWVSPHGNLYASLLLVDPCGPASAPELGFVAGVALHETVAAETGLEPPRLGLKWPNDLLLDGAKVAGLLLEAQQLLGGTFVVVIGFGVNITAAPDDTPYPAKALASVRSDLSAERLFARLAGSFAGHYEAWRSLRERGKPAFDGIRNEWIARAAGIGDRVTIRLPGGEREGLFMGLDGTGRLQLRTVAGTELIDAGDLCFPNSCPTNTRAPSFVVRSR